MAHGHTAPAALLEDKVGHGAEAERGNGREGGCTTSEKTPGNKPTLLQIPGRRKNQGQQERTDFLGAQTRKAGEAPETWLLQAGEDQGLHTGGSPQPREETPVRPVLYRSSTPHTSLLSPRSAASREQPFQVRSVMERFIRAVTVP